MPSFSELLTHSRPRFWSYLAGTYWLGVISGVETFAFSELSFLVLIFGLYFLLPANSLLYGVNDLADEQTDIQNPKKRKQEKVLKGESKSWMRWLVVGWLGVSLVLLILSPNVVVSASLVGFVLLALGYSVEPIRFKAKAFLDAYSNVLYILPFGVGFGLVSSGVSFSTLPWLGILAAGLWAVAMHTYSAIPDILPDKSAGITTTAVLLGAPKALVFVSAHWLGSSILAGIVGGLWGAPILIYPAIGFAHLLTAKPVRDWYWFFPYINFGIGAYLWWITAYLRFFAHA